jgi:hypothetical protein
MDRIRSSGGALIVSPSERQTLAAEPPSWLKDIQPPAQGIAQSCQFFAI